MFFGEVRPLFVFPYFPFFFFTPHYFLSQAFACFYLPIPFLALCAKDIDNLLLAGRCISGDFACHASYRMTGTAVPMGEAAGLAAAWAVKNNKLPHHWDEVPFLSKEN